MKQIFIVVAMFAVLAGATVAQADHTSTPTPSPIDSDVFQGD